MSHDSTFREVNDSPEVWTIVVAGGSGTRFGERKQFLKLAGRTVLERSVDVARTVSTGIVAVLPADVAEDLEALAELDLRPNRFTIVVAGGTSRAESVRRGLAAIPDTADLVLVHDAARPLASSSLFERVVAELMNGSNAVLPGIAIADSVRSRVAGVLDRDELVAVQTPQGFPLRVLQEAHRSGRDASDDATLVELLGHDVVIIEGEHANHKITHPADLDVASIHLVASEGER